MRSFLPRSGGAFVGEGWRDRHPGARALSLNGSRRARAALSQTAGRSVNNGAATAWGPGALWLPAQRERTMWTAKGSLSIGSLMAAPLRE